MDRRNRILRQTRPVFAYNRLFTGKGDAIRYDMPCEGMPRVKRRFLAEGTVYAESCKHFAFSAVFHSQMSRRNGFTKGEVRYC